MADSKLLLTLFLLVLPQAMYATEGTCLKFEFKNLTKETITRDENSTFRLLFTTVVSPPTCANTTLPENFTIVVSKTGEETLGTICEYRHRDRVCHQTLYSDISCGCNTTERLYSFTKKLTRKDSGKWIWSTKPKGVITSKEMTFNITYPARVRSLRLRDTEDREISSVDEGSGVLLICFWDPGRPPTTHEARIVDRHGQKINATNIPNNELRQIRYRFKAVKCADTGTFRCEIPGHNQSKAVTLLVRCPVEITLPQNEMAVTPGGSVVMKANIRSYTRNLTQCTVTKTFRSGNARGPQQCNITNLTGSSPDLTLTIQLYNIQEEEDGEWTLYIANDKGDGQVDFKIKIADTPFEITLPQNEMDVTPGGSVVLKANIRSYTSKLTECTVTKKFRSANARGPQQCNITDLTGSPPDLTLTIHLDNIQEEEDGEWTLYIADDKGDGQVDFKINITDTSLPLTSLAAIAAGVVVFVGMFAVLMSRRSCVRRKGHRIETRYRRSAPHGDEGHPVDTSRRSSEDYHVYHETGEGAVQILAGAGVFPLRARGPLPVPPGAGEEDTPVFFHADTEAGPDDGYLTPVPTRKSKRGAHVCSPRSGGAIADDGYLTPEPSRQARTGAAGGRDRTPASLSSEDYSESYERPVNPDYTTPNPQYEPLRHLYESVRQDGSTKKSRKQKN